MSMPGPEPSATIRVDGDVIRRLLRIAWDYRGHALGVILLQVVLLAMTLGGLGFTGLAVDVIRRSLDPKAPQPHWPFGIVTPGDWSTMRTLLVIGVLVLVASIVGSSVNYAYSTAVGRLVHLKIVPNLRTILYRRLQRLSFRFFDANASGAIVNRVTVDVQMLRSFVDGVVIQGTVLLLSLGVFLTYMLATHVRLTLVSLSLTPLLYLATRAFSRWARPAYREGRRLSDSMVRNLTESIEGIQVIKVFGTEASQTRKFEVSNREVREQQFKIFKNVSRFGPSIDLLNQLNIAVLLGYGGWLVAARQISLGELVVFAGLLRQFASRASAMADIVNVLQQSTTGARRVFEILDAPAEVENTSEARDPKRLNGQVELDDVHFGYDPGQPIVRGISLKTAPGRLVGILGTTGSGKSTLLSLIPRFYDPTRGCVRIDGTDVRQLDLDQLRRQIGVVFQENLLFRDTVANNIAFGHPDASREQIERASRTAGAHDFILELDQGYDTMLEEGAVNLSGGQRQRLAIARALLLDPPVLLLDDPTTAVDATTEAEILRAIGNAIRGRTTFLVSNRINALRRADEIIVLGDGRIAERGSHEALMSQGGLYFKTARLLSDIDEQADMVPNTEGLACHPR